MAARLLAAAAKGLLTEESSVLKTAVQTIKTTAVEEASMTVDSAAGRVESTISRTNVSEVSFGRNPLEVELPGTKANEVEPGRYSGKRKEIDIDSPEEIKLPDAKRNAEIKPADPAEVKKAEKDVVAEKEEAKLSEQVNNTIPTDPNQLLAAEQGRQQPEIGESRVVNELNRRQSTSTQESTENGAKTQDVGKKNEGPDVGSNPRDTMI